MQKNRWLKSRWPESRSPKYSDLPWGTLWSRLTPRCERDDCARAHTLWGRLRGQPRGIRLASAWYCREQCLERALGEVLDRMRPAPGRKVAHRIPLGLVLLAREQLTEAQLRTALEAQRRAGYGKIGEWLQSLGFVSEAEITAALARQWSCPVLPARSPIVDPGRVPQLPLALLESFAMLPVDYVSATATLHIAFSQGIDYTVLYAIGQMLGCRTEPCLVLPGLLRQGLAAFAEGRVPTEVVIDRVKHPDEVARIVASYAGCVSALELRLAACGPHLWVRLLRPVRPPIDLVLRSADPATLPAARGELAAPAALLA